MKGIVLAVIVAAATAADLSARETIAGSLLVSNPVLAASVDRLNNQSRTFREALESVTPTGRRTIVTTPDQVNVDFDADVLAQAYPLNDDQSRLDAVVIVVNLELLRKLSGLPMKAVDFEDDLDRIIAHEVYGHAVPLLLAGNLSGHCPDPAIGQSALTSCAVQRENVIRREVGLGQRVEYGRDSLAMARRQR